MTIILYMQNFSAPVRSVLLTAEAIGVQLQKKVIDLSKGEHLTPEFRKVNPQHTIPTLDDNGFVVWDSHAINAYLVGKYAKDDSLYPKDLARRAVVDQRLHFDSGSVFSWMRIISRGVKYRGLKALTDEQIAGITDGYTHLESFLANSRWVAGPNPTIADFSLVSSVSSLDLLLPVDGQQFPKVKCWLRSCGEFSNYEANNLRGLADLRGMLQVIAKK